MVMVVMVVIVIVIMVMVVMMVVVVIVVVIVAVILKSARSSTLMFVTSCLLLLDCLEIVGLVAVGSKFTLTFKNVLHEGLQVVFIEGLSHLGKQFLSVVDGDNGRVPTSLSAEEHFEVILISSLRPNESERLATELLANLPDGFQVGLSLFLSRVENVRQERNNADASFKQISTLLFAVSVEDGLRAQLLEVVGSLRASVLFSCPFSHCG